MIGRITLSIAALGLLIATADAAQMTSPAPHANAAMAADATPVMTGRSGWHHHGHWHHHRVWHRHWHHHWHHH